MNRFIPVFLLLVGSALGQQAGGICMTDSIPPNVVVVGRYFSEQCPYSTLGNNVDVSKPNAFRIAGAADGLRSCQPPPLSSGLFACDVGSSSKDCGGQPDFGLATPQRCAISHRSQSLDLDIFCPNRAVPDGWVMVGQTHSQFCSLSGANNAWVIRRIAFSTLSLPAPRPGAGLRGSATPAPDNDVDANTNPLWKCHISPSLPSQGVIVGRFQSPSCPAMSDSSLNTDQISVLPTVGTGHQIQVCTDSPVPPGYKTQTGTTPGPLLRTSPSGRRIYGPGTPVLITVHNDECGGSGPNAKLIFYSTMGP
jgi:hypothetical protein